VRWLKVQHSAAVFGFGFWSDEAARSSKQLLYDYDPAGDISGTWNRFQKH
jgi:hypothetical protein